ncbi:MAG: hypothetical protein WAM66_02360 [Acidobacteriaceae bacterium]
MRFPVEFAVACAAAIAFVIAGRFFVHRPEQVYRAVSFGREPDRMGVRLMRGVGWFYICAGTIAAVLFLAVTLLSLIHSH